MVLRSFSFLCALPLMLVLLAPPALGLEQEEELIFFRKLYADSLFEVAAGQMETFLQRHPEHPQRPELSYLLGHSYLALKQGEPALRWLSDFVDARPEDPRACEALYDAARVGVRQGLLEQTEPILDKLLREYGDCDKRDLAIHLSARVKGARGETAAAIQLLSFLIDSSGDEELVGKALFERASIKRESDPAAGRADFEALKATLPRHPLAGFAARQLAETALAEGREADALAELDWVLRNFSEADLAAPALERKAEILAVAERYEAAATALAERRRRYPGRAGGLRLLEREVELLTAAGRGAEAIERAGDTLAMLGETARAYVLLAEALEADARLSEACVAWQKAVDLDRGGETGLIALRSLFKLLLRGDDSARLGAVSTQLLAALRSAEGRAELLLEFGAHHAAAARPELAKRIWESVETEAPGSPLIPETLFRLALLQEERGLWEEAESYYNRLILEHGASARGLQAREGKEALERYYRRDEAGALEKLLAMFEEERRQGVVRGREFKIGRLLRDDLKDFPRQRTTSAGWPPSRRAGRGAPGLCWRGGAPRSSRPNASAKRTSRMPRSPGARARRRRWRPARRSPRIRCSRTPNSRSPGFASPNFPMVPSACPYSTRFWPSTGMRRGPRATSTSGGSSIRRGAGPTRRRRGARP